MIPPDLRGTYAGTGTFTQTNCQDPINNVTLPFAASINVLNQIGETFGGSGSLTGHVTVMGQTIPFTTSIDFSGTVTVAGALAGPFTFTTQTGGVVTASGDASFAGSVSGNTLAFNFTGQIRVGESCTITGSLTATR